MNTQPWPLLAALTLCGAVLNGCSSPFTNEDIFGRLSLEGIPRPEIENGVLSDSPRSDQSDLPSTGITLAVLLHRTEQVNPDLLSARSSVGIAAGQVWQAGLYPNPSASVTSSEISFEGGSANTIVGVTQPIVIGGRLRAAIAAADAEQAAKLADVERVRLEVFGRVIELHARVLELDAQLKLIEELISIGQQTLDIAETRFEARAVSEPDVIRPRVELYQLRADQQRIVQELMAVEKQLGLMLNTDQVSANRLEASISMTPVALDEKRLIAAVENGHPALLVADRKIESTQANIQRIRAERVPDLNISAGVGYSEENDGSIAEIGVGTEIPLWDRRQGDMMSARFELMKLRQDKAATRNRLLSDLADAIGEYDAAREQLRVIRDDVVPEAQRAFDQIDESYRAGRASFIDLLDAQRTLMQSRRTLIQLAGQASVAWARISVITGMEGLLSAVHHNPQ